MKTTLRLLVVLGLVAVLAMPAYAAVTARFNMTPGVNYKYSIDYQSHKTETSSLDPTNPHVLDNSLTGTLTSEVASNADQRWSRLVTYVIDTGTSSVTIDNTQTATTNHADDDLQREKMDNRGFTREDIVPLENFSTLCGNGGVDGTNAKPVLSGLHLYELPPDAMSVNGTWTATYDAFADCTGGPISISVRWTLLSESELRQGIACAKYKVEVLNGTFSGISLTQDVVNVGTVTSTLACTANTTTGYLWFDIAGGKIVEWNLSLSETSTDQQTVPTGGTVTTESTASVSYVYAGTR